MSYLCRVTVEAQSSALSSLITRMRTSPYAQHQTLWTLFDRPPGTTQPFVFREMKIDSPHLMQFLLLGDDQPRAREGFAVEAKPFAPRLQAGVRFHFQLRANPTRTVFQRGQRGKRQDYVMSRLHESGATNRAAERQRIIHEELPVWLGRLGERNGFAVSQCAVQHYEVLRFTQWKTDPATGKTVAVPITCSAADFVGTLSVTDGERFGQVLREGIGHGRSFGLGLLLIRPA